MSPFNNQDISKGKRLPFTDKTNLVSRDNTSVSLKGASYYKIGTLEYLSRIDSKFRVKLKVHLPSCNITNKELSTTSDPTESQKVALEQMISNDPKFKLIPKVHLQFCNIINKKLSGTSDPLKSHQVALEQIIANNPKFMLIPKVHLQSCNIINKKPSGNSDPLKSHQVALEQIITNDPKFKLNLKVHLQRLDNNDKMPNLQSTKLMSNDGVLKRNGIIRNVSENLNIKPGVAINCIKGNIHKFVPNGVNGIVNTVKHINNQVLKSKNISDRDAGENIIGKNSKLDPKFYQKLVVQVNRCKKLEETLKINNKSKETVKKVHFSHDIDATPKFDKALRKRRTRNYAELSFRDGLSPEKNPEHSYKEHVPVYLQSTAIEQKQKGKDPFEFINDSLTNNPKKKRRRGRQIKEIWSPLQLKKRKKGRPPQEASSDSDASVYDRSMHEILKAIEHKLGSKKGKYVKRIKNHVKQNNNVKVVTNQIRNRQIHIVPSKSSMRKKAGPINIQEGITGSRTEAKQQNFNGVVNRNANCLILSSNSKAGPSKDVVNKNTLTSLAQEIENISGRISRISSQSSVDIESEADECDRYFGFDDDYEDDDISRVLPTTKGFDALTTFNNIKPIAVSEKFTSLTSTPLPSVQRRSLKTTATNPKRINIISNILVSPSQKAKTQKQSVISKAAMPAVIEISTLDSLPKEDNLLVFDYSHQRPSTSTGFNSMPSAVQNVETSKNVFMGSVAHQTKSTENGFRGFVNANNRSISNNTMRRQTSNGSSSPWRGDRLHIKRNPHFLTIKDTSLPCYNQEMIMEPKLLERPQTPGPNKKTRSNKVQKSILDFVSSNKINSASTPTKKNHNMSLFDDDDFSPIRSKNTNENSSPDKNSKDDEKLQNSKTKRNIFGVSKKKQGTSPLRQRNREEECGIENYFGFDSPRATGKENMRITRNKTKQENKNEEALPMRVPIKQLKKVREDAVEELLDKINLEESVGEEPIAQEIAENALPDKTLQDDDMPHVGLFEDLEEVKPRPRIYERKRTKRVRIASIDSDREEEEKPKRKRKDIRTPAEEEEFDRWAAQFNAMCNEVENHSLETA